MRSCDTARTSLTKVAVNNSRAVLLHAQRSENGASSRYIRATITAPAMALGNHALRPLTVPNGSDASQMNKVESDV